LALFVEEELPLFSYETTQRLEDTFKQKPMILPLTQPKEIVYIHKHDYLPALAIVAIVLGAISIVGLLAFFGSRRS